VAEEYVPFDLYRANLADFRADLARFREELRVEMHREFSQVHTEVAGLRGEMYQAITAQTKWLGGVILTAAGLTVALVKLL
jgi:hypothetical protein